MRFLKVCTAIVMALGLLSVSAPAKAGLVSWDVDSTQSFMRLNLPDFNMPVDGLGNVNVRVRNANNATWSDAGGRRAFLDGTIQTNLVDGSSVQFLSGAHNLYAVEGTQLRPNPASFDPSLTNADNPDGQYTDGTTALAAFGAKVRGNYAIIINIDAAYFAMRNFMVDLISGAIPLGGGTTIAGSSFDLGSALTIDVDGLSTVAGQLVPDIFNANVVLPGALNVGGGSVTSPDPVNFPLLRRLALTINVPLALDLDGIVINGSATGQIVAFATIPEPSSVLLAGFAAFGLIWAGRRRIRRS